ncbi:hypothetical protein EYR41_005911 [Orbilia oligospora]|uniref:Uncharacterized protein n=1 Tax=Orbilia oligospora TaxID=2813651 RepID=A0A7C8PXW1_ORBOL|nr:hypothetical protein TWF751_004255 [Orbilia oligospora]TGJ69904.1 hypothetical protein EYR41_005911 [Orbilia oligospora]
MLMTLDSLHPRWHGLWRYPETRHREDIFDSLAPSIEPYDQSDKINLLNLGSLIQSLPIGLANGNKCLNFYRRFGGLMFSIRTQKIVFSSLAIHDSGDEILALSKCHLHVCNENVFIKLRVFVIRIIGEYFAPVAQKKLKSFQAGGEIHNGVWQEGGSNLIPSSIYFLAMPKPLRPWEKAFRHSK